MNAELFPALWTIWRKVFINNKAAFRSVKRKKYYLLLKGQANSTGNKSSGFYPLVSLLFFVKFVSSSNLKTPGPTVSLCGTHPIYAYLQET